MSLLTDPRSHVDGIYRGAIRKPLCCGMQGLLWDPVAAMPPPARDLWRERAIPMAVSLFDTTTPQWWLRHWSDTELDRLSLLHVALSDEGEPKGWVSVHRLVRDRRQVVLYCVSAGVAADVQGGGLAGMLCRRVVVREIIRTFPRTLYLVMRTANPLVYEACRSGGCQEDAVHPRPGIPVPPDIAAVARDTAEFLGHVDDFDPTTLRINGAYRALLPWRARPCSRDEGTNDWFNNTLQPSDAYLVITRVTPASTVRLCLRVARRRNRPR